MESPGGPRRVVRPGRKAVFALTALVSCLALLEGAAHLLSALELPPFASPPPRFDIIDDLEADKGGGCFVRDPVLFWKLRPGLQGCPWRTSTGRVVSIRTNEFGLRSTGRPYRREREPGSLRILAVGDSVTFGLWVDDDETFAECLRRALTKAMPDRSVEVINAGVPGYSSYQGITFFRGEGLAFRPDIATICFGYNDQNPSEMPDRVLGEDPQHRDVLAGRDRRLPGLRRLLHRSVLYRALVRVVQGSPEGRPRGPRDVPRVGPEEYRRNMTEFLRLCRQGGVQPIFIPTPWGADLAPASTRAIREYRRIVHELAAPQGAPVVNLGPLTEGHQDRNKGLFHDVIHPNARGHRVLAEALLGTILELPRRGAGR